MSKWPLNDRVEVQWRDSAQSGRGWDDVRVHRRDNGIGPIRSIGYLLSKNRDVVQLSQSISSMTGHTTAVITIPRENVPHIRRLK